MMPLIFLDGLAHGGAALIRAVRHLAGRRNRIDDRAPDFPSRESQSGFFWCRDFRNPTGTPGHFQERPISAKSLIQLVGARGFEPPTPSPPDWCANQAALRSAISSPGPGGLAAGITTGRWMRSRSLGWRWCTPCGLRASTRFEIAVTGPVPARHTAAGACN